MPERWLPVPGYEGLYEVSNIGRVRSLPHKTRQGMRGGRMRKTPLNAGYPVVSLYANGVGRVTSVHLLVAAAFIGPRPPGMEVRHLDGNPSNCVLSNLTYGTHTENMRDMLTHGTARKAVGTQCSRGHEYPEGKRKCRACERIGRRRRKRNRMREEEVAA
jgi:hypothetical protein